MGHCKLIKGQVMVETKGKTRTKISGCYLLKYY